MYKILNVRKYILKNRVVQNSGSGIIVCFFVNAKYDDDVKIEKWIVEEPKNLPT